MPLAHQAVQLLIMIIKVIRQKLSYCDILFPLNSVQCVSIQIIESSIFLMDSIGLVPFCGSSASEGARIIQQ